MLLAMRFWIRIATAFFLSSQLYAQTGSAELVTEIDLKQLGVKVPARGAVSKTALELLFLSDSDLAVLQENDRPGKSKEAHLMLYELGKGIIQPKKAISPSEWVMPISHDVKAMELIDPEHFVYRTYLGEAGRWLCDADLNCKEVRVELESGALPHAGECKSEDLLGFIDPQEAVCLRNAARTKFSADVIDTKGHLIYEVERRALPWNTKMVSSAQGQRFGLEWTSNTVLQLLDPLACIDECPPAGKQQFVILDSISGRIMQSFEWDPRPYNLYVLPALSPSGNTAAFVRKDKLVVYSLDALH
jgi:hypothetical protein